MGNRLVKMDATASGTVTTNSAFDLANRLTSVGGASYVTDANGNTLAGGGRVMTWDSQNRMVSCADSGNTLTFDYGSDGLRRSETLTSGGQSVTTYYVYDGQSLVMEETRNAQGQLVASASYLNGPRGPEYKKDETTGLVKWYVYDGLGSVVGEVDPSGNVTYSGTYDVYGAVRGASGASNTAQGFVGGLGHLSEQATGLIYMRARYYDPNTGRFVSEDPKYSGGNWYTYCNDNPVNRIDKTGKSPTIITTGGDDDDGPAYWAYFEVLLDQWVSALAASEAFRADAADFLEGVNVLLADGGTPNQLAAREELNVAFEATVSSPATGGSGAAVAQVYGYETTLELWAWFLGDGGLGAPNSIEVPVPGW